MGQHKHLYNKSRWTKSLRPQQLARQPLCCMCSERGIVSAASVVDHIKPHRGDLELFGDPNNLQSLCKLCHDGAKQAHERGQLLRGCGLDGLPLDARHPWRAND